MPHHTLTGNAEENEVERAARRLREASTAYLRGDDLDTDTVEGFIALKLRQAYDERMRDHGAPDKVLIQGCKCDVCQAARDRLP